MNQTNLNQQATPIVWIQFIVLMVLISAQTLYAQSREELELSASELFNRSFSGAVVFESREEGLTGLQQEGCPETTSLTGTKGEIIDLQLTTGSPGSWAGDIDGINTNGTVASLNEQVSTFIVPINLPSIKGSTSRGIFDDSVVEYRTFRIINVNRPEFEALEAMYNEALSSCLKLLPKNQSFTPDELAARCSEVGNALPPRPTKSQVGQTCFQDVSIYLKPIIESPESFEVTYFVDELCDFVGYPQSSITEESNISFTSCFSDTYRGQVVFDSEQSVRTKKLKKQMRRGARVWCRNNIVKKSRNRKQRLQRCQRKLAKRNGI